MRYGNFLAVWTWLCTLVMRMCPGLRNLLVENRKLRQDSSRLLGNACSMAREIQRLQAQRVYLLDQIRQLETELASAHETGHGLLRQVDELVRQQTSESRGSSPDVLLQ